jgi:hypothetical protein
MRTSLTLWAVPLAAAIVIYQAYSPILGGLILGGAGSLAAFRYKIWTLRRFAARASAQSAYRLPLLDAGRYLIMIAVMIPAAWLAVNYDMKHLFAAAAALFLTNVATVVQAVREARQT